MFPGFSTIPEISVPHFKGGQGAGPGAHLRTSREDSDPDPAAGTIGHHVHEGSFEVMHFLSPGRACASMAALPSQSAQHDPLLRPRPQPQRGQHRRGPLVILGVVPQCESGRPLSRRPENHRAIFSTSAKKAAALAGPLLF